MNCHKDLSSPGLHLSPFFYRVAPNIVTRCPSQKAVSWLFETTDTPMNNGWRGYRESLAMVNQVVELFFEKVQLFNIPNSGVPADSLCLCFILAPSPFLSHLFVSLTLQLLCCCENEIQWSCSYPWKKICIEISCLEHEISHRKRYQKISTCLF